MNEMEMNSKVTNEQGFGGVAAPAEKAAAPAQRDLNTVTTEIQTLQRQAQQMALGYAVEIGRRLTEAKALVGYGEWGDYIKKKLGYSQSTANNLMRLFDAYGDRQIGLLGATADCQTFGNLSYSKALALLAVPEEEREEFATDHDVESMSTRELERAIRERDEEKAKVERARAERDAEYDRAEKLEHEVEDARKAAEEAAQALAAAKEELDALKNKPIDVAVEQPDPAAVDRLAEEKLAEAQKAHEEKVAELEKKLADAEAAAKEAEKALKNAQDGAADLKAKAQAAAQAEVEDLKKKLAVAAPEVAAFQVHYDVAQREFATMVETVDKLRREGHEKASGLHAALQALAKWAAEVAG